ncbi:MAG: TerB N-terminal domain-containing protein, partial [Rickettsiales bacterium]|nr:TerB N-terminal domain-containing protein [Rickettsiales bacterium]
MFFTVVFIIYGAIVIRYGRCKIKELVIWHPKNTAVELSGFVISGGMIYTTSELTESAHIISTRFPVACHDPLFTLSKKSGQQITYSTMNKYQRRLYLKWLAGNRSDAKIGIEYVFLFFYGLEWRFFEIDNNMDFLLEKEDIIQELQRLAAVYDHDDSFRKQVKKLLSFNALCSYGGIGISKEEFEKYNYPPTTDLNDIPSTIENDTLSQVRELFTVEDETPIDLKILLGSAIGSHMPIPAILALLWVKTSKDYRIYFGATVRRYEDKFNKLFVQRYYAKYGAGIVVDKKPGTELYLRYELATPGGRCFIKRVGTAVDIRYYSYCLVILQEIVNEATNLLEISYATIWHPMGSAVDIQNIRIPGGMIYTKSKNSNLRCVIATNLPISDYSSKIKPSKLSYWPSYSTGTSKEQRRAYLTWLANGRCEPVDDIGYVFLFFYGLEQRYFEILVNDSPEKEMEQIKNEVRRLLEIYGQDSSFRMYANQFLNYMEANVVPNEDIDLSKFEKYTYFNRETHETPIDLKITLGNLIYRGKPIPVTMALAWLKNPGGYAATFRTPARRCEKEFNELFIQKYQEK